MRLDGGQRFDAVLPRHRDVQHDDVGGLLAHHVHDFAPAGAFGHDAQVDVFVEELAQTGAHQRVVVDDGNSDHVSKRPGLRAARCAFACGRPSFQPARCGALLVARG